MHSDSRRKEEDERIHSASMRKEEDERIQILEVEEEIGGWEVGGWEIRKENSTSHALLHWYTRSPLVCRKHM